MNRYQVIKALGDGTYGSVFRAVNRSTGEVVRLRVACGARAASRHPRSQLRLRRPRGTAPRARPRRWRSRR